MHIPSFTAKMSITVGQQLSDSVRGGVAFVNRSFNTVGIKVIPSMKPRCDDCLDICDSQDTTQGFINCASKCITLGYCRF